jgi:outer membrane protein TolC
MRPPVSQRKPRGAALIVSLLLASWAYAGEPGSPLPEPLTLPAALSMADSTHPDVAVVEADNAARRAQQLAVEALTGVATRFDADDRADGMLLAHARQHRRTKILRCYLGVLLADLTFTLENEAMAMAYVRMNRARERHTLGQVSDIALAERSSRYQAARRQRYAAEAAQRASRSRLALALNRPGELATLLLPPRLPGNHDQRPELEEIEARALNDNTRLQALRLRMQAARQRLEATRKAADSAPKDEARESDGMISRERLLSAAAAGHQAELVRLQSRLGKLQLDVRQAILDAWLELETLYAARQAASDYADYRDLYLDLNRALYEQEVNADLGDAMVKTSEARLGSVQAEFAIARTWARIRLLTGTSPEDMSASILGTEP